MDETNTPKWQEHWFNWVFDNPFISFTLKILLAVVVVWLLMLVSKLIANFIKKRIIANAVIDDAEYVAKVWNLIWDVIFYTLATFDIIIWFEILWFDLTLLMWWLSFGIWLAFKETLWNMIAGVLILTTKDFSLWDLIKIEWQKEYFWRIEEITIRYTVIREFNNQKIIIPNLTLITTPIKTFTTEEFVRVETTVSVHYNTDLEHAKKIIVEAIKKLKFVVNKEYTKAITTNFWDNWINITVRFFIDPNSDILPATAISIVNDTIKKVFDENDIVIPYPHTTITVDKNDKNLLKSLLFLKKSN